MASVTDTAGLDIVLEAGESFTGTGHRRAPVYAIRSSNLAITPAAQAAL